jgi:hypothetical protein
MAATTAKTPTMIKKIIAMNAALLIPKVKLTIYCQSKATKYQKIWSNLKYNTSK